MPYKRFDLRSYILLAIFTLVVIFLIFGLGVGNGIEPITGFAIHGCHYDVGGVKCHDTFYQLYVDSCPADTIPVCTNMCELDRFVSKNDRICPAYCEKYCVPADISGLL